MFKVITLNQQDYLQLLGQVFLRAEPEEGPLPSVLAVGHLES